MTETKTFNEQIIEEFRANEGKVAMFADFPMIILHTIGRKTGNTHLVPLVLTINADNEMLLFGSFAGAKKDPVWAHSLRANPDINVEVGTEKFATRIEEFSDEAAKDTVRNMAGSNETFAGYVTSAAPRDIPVFKIHRV